jgi:death on curing protein
MRFLNLIEILELHRRILEQTGGAVGVRSLEALQSSLALPQATFDRHDLYPSIVEKAAALGFSLILNHPFVDGNKRVGHAAMEVFLVLNGFEVDATVTEQEETILLLAAGKLNKLDFIGWLGSHTKALN